MNERAGELEAAGAGGPMGAIGLDTDHMDRAGIDLGATGRLQLMAKLAEGNYILTRNCIALQLEFRCMLVLKFFGSLYIYLPLF